MQLQLAVLGVPQARWRRRREPLQPRAGAACPPSAVSVVGAGRRVGGLERLVVGLVQDGGPAEPSASVVSVGVDGCGPGGQRRGRRAGQEASARSSASADQ